MKLGFINPLNVSFNGLPIKVTLFELKFDLFILKKIFLIFNTFKVYKFKYIWEEQLRTYISYYYYFLNLNMINKRINKRTLIKSILYF